MPFSEQSERLSFSERSERMSLNAIKNKKRYNFIFNQKTKKFYDTKTKFECAGDYRVHLALRYDFVRHKLGITYG
jgi:hypothetical protein